jgi:hypothetical protein
LAWPANWSAPLVLFEVSTVRVVVAWNRVPANEATETRTRIETQELNLNTPNSIARQLRGKSYSQAIDHGVSQFNAFVVST